MCNAYEQHVKWVEYCKMMQALELGIPTQQSELDLPESDDVRINDMAPVMRAAGNNIELVSMNFSFPPSGPKGGPVFNFGRKEEVSPTETGVSFRHRDFLSLLARNIRRPSIASR
jgi:hypothetical protein